MISQKTSYADDMKVLASAIAPMMKEAGFRKRRHSFNKDLPNGLVHELNLYQIPAFSAFHGTYRIEFGCFIPEVELYRQNNPSSSWKTNPYCAVRGFFPDRRIETLAPSIETLKQTVSDALDELRQLGDRTTLVAALASNTTLMLETPLPIIKACLFYCDGQKEAAFDEIERHLAASALQHPGHAAVVAEWKDALKAGKIII